MKPNNFANYLLLISSFTICIFVLEFGSYLIIRNLVVHHNFFDRDDKFSSYLTIFNNDVEYMPLGVKTNYTQTFRRKEFEDNIRLNNIGLREDEDYKGQRIDISFIGDSFTFGHGVNYGERYSDLLRTYYPKKKIFSLSYKNGWAPPHYYIFLRENPHLIGKKVVLGLFLGNDLSIDMESTDLKFDDSGRLIGVKSNRRKANKYGMFVPKDNSENFSDSLYFNLVKSEFGRLLVITYGVFKGTYRKIGSKAGSQENDRFFLGELNKVNFQALEFVLKVSELVKKNDSELVVFIIPRSFMIGNYENQCPFSQAFCGEIRESEKLMNTVAKFLSGEKIKVVNPASRFKELEKSGTKLYYQWDGHWNTTGHQVAAELLYKSNLLN